MSDALAAEWQVWIAANLLRGRPQDELVATLLGEGLTVARATEEVRAIALSPGVLAARETLRPVQLAQRLRREHLRLGRREIPVVPGLDRETFQDRHVAVQVPALLPDLTVDWPARAWSWELLRERFGGIAVDVCSGRLGARRPDRRYRDHVVQRPFSDVVDRVLDPSTGNDLYVVANNKALDGPLAGMRAGVGRCALLDPARLAYSSVWIGPAGAKTPLHHDTSDVLLCQFLGRKRILLAPPEEVELADHGAGFWCDLDLDDAAGLEAAGIEGAAIREVVVGPGDTLFLPAGWWHQVVSLEPSLTITFAGLWHENRHPWYRPSPPDLGEGGDEADQS